MISFCVRGVQSKWLDMVNVESLAKIRFVQAATLANAIVTGVRSLALRFPICTIVGRVTAAPTVAILAHHIFRLPFAHAVSAAKVMLVSLAVSAIELLTAIVAMQFLASPSQHHAFALEAASNSRRHLECFVQPVRFGVELFVAYWASGVNHLRFAVDSLAVVRAKPKTCLVTFDEAIGALKFFLAVITMNFHRCIIAHLNEYGERRNARTTIIACEQLGRKCRAVEISPGYVAVALQRWADATGETPTLCAL